MSPWRCPLATPATPSPARPLCGRSRVRQAGRRTCPIGTWVDPGPGAGCIQKAFWPLSSRLGLGQARAWTQAHLAVSVYPHPQADPLDGRNVLEVRHGTSQRCADRPRRRGRRICAKACPRPGRPEALRPLKYRRVLGAAPGGAIRRLAGCQPDSRSAGLASPYPALPCLASRASLCLLPSRFVLLSGRGEAALLGRRANRD